MARKLLPLIHYSPGAQLSPQFNPPKPLACCPSCKRPLIAEKKEGLFAVYCGNPHCDSVIANTGASGSTPDEAMDNFNAKMAKNI
jgi:hypothetical protein